MAGASTGVMIPPDAPLKQADLKLINQGLYKLNQALELIDQAASAGIDMSEIRLMRDDTYAQLVALKQTFFPGSQ